MAQDQIKRFERWRKRLPENTAYFVALVLDEIVPMFLQRGYGRYPDYAGGSAFAVGPNCVPLQRRSGAEWPTVEILFDKRSRPALGADFATLPEVCVRQTEHGPRDIPRIEANVVEGRAFFILCKGQHRDFDCNFGYRWCAWLPKRKLDHEVGTLRAVVPWMLDILDHGIPQSWYRETPGYIDRHAFLSPASRMLMAPAFQLPRSSS